jgi:hypothetical protein
MSRSKVGRRWSRGFLAAIAIAFTLSALATPTYGAPAGPKHSQTVSASLRSAVPLEYDLDPEAGYPAGHVMCSSARCVGVDITTTPNYGTTGEIWITLTWLNPVSTSTSNNFLSFRSPSGVAVSTVLISGSLNIWHPTAWGTSSPAVGAQRTIVVNVTGAAGLGCVVPPAVAVAVGSCENTGTNFVFLPPMHPNRSDFAYNPLLDPQWSQTVNAAFPEGNVICNGPACVMVDVVESPAAGATGELTLKFTWVSNLGTIVDSATYDPRTPLGTSAQTTGSGDFELWSASAWGTESPLFGTTRLETRTITDTQGFGCATWSQYPAGPGACVAPGQPGIFHPRGHPIRFNIVSNADERPIPHAEPVAGFPLGKLVCTGSMCVQVDVLQSPPYGRPGIFQARYTWKRASNANTGSSGYAFLVPGGGQNVASVVVSGDPRFWHSAAWGTSTPALDQKRTVTVNITGSQGLGCAVTLTLPSQGACSRYNYPPMYIPSGAGQDDPGPAITKITIDGESALYEATSGLVEVELAEELPYGYLLSIYDHNGVLLAVCDSGDACDASVSLGPESLGYYFAFVSRTAPPLNVPSGAGSRLGPVILSSQSEQEWLDAIEDYANGQPVPEIDDILDLFDPASICMTAGEAVRSHRLRWTAPDVTLVCDLWGMGKALRFIKGVGNVADVLELLGSLANGEFGPFAPPAPHPYCGYVLANGDCGDLDYGSRPGEPIYTFVPSGTSSPTTFTQPPTNCLFLEPDGTPRLDEQNALDTSSRDAVLEALGAPQVHYVIPLEGPTYDWAAEFLAREGYDLDFETGAWNQVSVPHTGTLSAEYHAWVRTVIREIADAADGDNLEFEQLFAEAVSDVVSEDSTVLRVGYWGCYR